MLLGYTILNPTRSSCAQISEANNQISSTCYTTPVQARRIVRREPRRERTIRVSYNRPYLPLGQLIQPVPKPLRCCWCCCCYLIPATLCRDLFVFGEKFALHAWYHNLFSSSIHRVRLNPSMQHSCNQIHAIYNLKQTPLPRDRSPKPYVDLILGQDKARTWHPRGSLS